MSVPFLPSKNAIISLIKGVRTTDILNQVKKYYNETEQRISFLEKELAEAPDGTIRIRALDGKKHYYHRFLSGNRLLERSIPHSDKSTITALAKKRYIRKVLPIMKQNLRAAWQFLLIHSGKNEDSIAADSIPMEILESIGEIYVTVEDRRRKWLTQTWTDQPGFDNMPQYRTLRGDYVRSKSEAFIADALYRHDLPYLYEKPLFLDGLRYPLFPDFTIYDPYTDREQFWEHFGMMENADYAEKVCRKLSYYLNAGLIPGHGLICTFETNHQPISSADIEMLIRTLMGSDQH